MKIKGFILLACIFFVGCSGSYVATGLTADGNVMRLPYVDLGMEKKQVRSIMGKPYYTQCLRCGEERYEIWFYLTSGIQTGQIYPHAKNFTPLIFKEGQLESIGYLYLKHLEEDPRLERKRSYYARNPTPEFEARKKKHLVISPPPYKRTDKQHLEDPNSTAVPKVEPIEETPISIPPSIQENNLPIDRGKKDSTDANADSLPVIDENKENNKLKKENKNKNKKQSIYKWN